MAVLDSGVAEERHERHAGDEAEWDRPGVHLESEGSKADTDVVDLVLWDGRCQLESQAI